jgi:hypothetical protein
MTKKARVTSRSGPRAPAGKRPLTAIIDETVIEEAKIKAIREKTNLSRVTQELLQGWLSGVFKLKKSDDQ